MTARAAISLDAYQLYMRGQELLANERIGDCEKAIELFERATILDPAFARAYLGLGQGHLLAFDLNGGDADQQLQAERALDRALELNPALGEAWVERARATRDPVKAETLYRQGLDQAPNYGAGYASFADFLFREGRTGEAINMVDRARAIDPLTPALHLRQAFFLIVTRSDVPAHDRLVLEALAINPDFQPALQQLAQSRWEYSGDFADAARIIERSIALDSQSGYSRSLATQIYLDLGSSPRQRLYTVMVRALLKRSISRSISVIRDVRQIWPGPCLRMPRGLAAPLRLRQKRFVTERSSLASMVRRSRCSNRPWLLRRACHGCGDALSLLSTHTRWCSRDKPSAAESLPPRL